MQDITRQIKPTCILNHNNGEAALTCKHRLSETLQRTQKTQGSDYRAIMPRQYVLNLNNEESNTVDLNQWLDEDFFKSFAESILYKFKDGDKVGH